MPANALFINDLHKTYKSGFTALRGVSLSVEEGDFFALLGPNGAGKSTLIGIVSALVNKTSGHVSVFDSDIDTALESAKSCLGVMPQEVNFNLWDGPLDIVVNQAGYYGIPRAVALGRAEHYLHALGLWEKRAVRARELSGGMKRRLMIARALVHEPRLLILDEPTAGVDIELRRSMWGFLQEINARGTTIILTTHYLEEAEHLCRNIAIIDHGRIVEDTNMKDLLNQLHVETFILDLAAPIESGPEIPGLAMRMLDDHTIEVDVTREYGVSALFDALSRANIEVASLRNKANRLEELFVRLIASDDPDQSRVSVARAEGLFDEPPGGAVG